MAVRKLPKEVLKMASGLILLSGLAGHRRPLCDATLKPGREPVRALQLNKGTNMVMTQSIEAVKF